MAGPVPFILDYVLTINSTNSEISLKLEQFLAIFVFCNINLSFCFAGFYPFCLKDFPNNFTCSSETTTTKKWGKKLKKKEGLEKKVICMWYFLPYLALYGNKATSSLSINNFMLVEFYVLSSNSSNLSNSLFRILISHLEL